MVHVLRVGARVREALSTFVTLVGFLTGVQPGVFDQVVFVFESFIADGAFMGPFSCRKNKSQREMLKTPMVLKGRES